METHADPKNPSNEATGAAFAITVAVQLEDGAMPEFLRLVSENAAQSVSREPHCFRFDVLVPSGGERASELLLYEIYRDRAAFDAHLASEHFLTFESQSRALVRRKTIAVYSVSQNTKGQDRP